MKLWPWIAGAGALGLAAVAGASPNIIEQPNIGGDMSARRERFLWALSLMSLDATQVAFFDITAKAESKYNPNAHNGTPSEVAASVRAADNDPKLVQRVRACGVPEEKLKTGSWGLVQRLAPYAANDAFEIFGANACALADPTRMSYAFQLASALETAGDLQQYTRFTAAPTLGNLRLGFGALSLMGYLAKNKARLDKYRATAVSLGYPASIIDAPIAPMPRNVATIYGRLIASGV